MSFRIYAAGVVAGSKPFVYSRNNLPDEGIFEAAAIASALRAVSGPRVTLGTRGNVALGAVEAVADYVCFPLRLAQSEKVFEEWQE